MNTIELLTSRHSEKQLTTPAPNQAQLNTIFKAAFRAPDHGHLQPYRFVVIEEEKMPELEKILVATVESENLEERMLKKAHGLPKRAPMAIAVIAKQQPDIAKVPTWEQMLTAGCATYAMQLSAKALGFDNIWVTNRWVSGTPMRKAFNCDEQEKIIALLLIGTAANPTAYKDHEIVLDNFVSYL